MVKFNIEKFFEILSGKNQEQLVKKMPVLQNPDFFFRFALAQGYGFKGPLYDFNDEAEPFPLKERFKHLGPEPFDKKFNLNYVLDFFKHKNKDIKTFLLDQRFVSGIGNIYASEILFLSKIDPFKQAKLLTKNECKKIILNSKKILYRAIIKGGSSIRNFQDISGTLGGYQKEFKVYQQEGNRCKGIRCFGIIKKKIVSNRSTFFCVSCQK